MESLSDGNSIVSSRSRQHTHTCHTHTPLTLSLTHTTHSFPTPLPTCRQKMRSTSSRLKKQSESSTLNFFIYMPDESYPMFHFMLSQHCAWVYHWRNVCLVIIQVCFIPDRSWLKIFQLPKCVVTCVSWVKIIWIGKCDTDMCLVDQVCHSNKGRGNFDHGMCHAAQDMRHANCHVTLAHRSRQNENHTRAG